MCNYADRQKKYYGLLKADFFLICLLTLILNDFCFKYKFPGLITGKLSDFTGLFIFPYFLSVFFPRLKNLFYFGTGLFFVFWKLPLSDNLVNYINTFDLFFIHRVKDLTDLTAILILPLSYIYFEKQKLLTIYITKFQTYFFLTVTLFSFAATTIGEKEYHHKIGINSSYLIPINKITLFKNYLSPSRGVLLSPNDSIFYIYFDPSNKGRVTITCQTVVKSLGRDSTIIRLDSIVKYDIGNVGLGSGPNEKTVKDMKTLKAKDYKELFENDVIKEILKKDSLSKYSIYYCAKWVADKYDKK